MQDGEPYLAGTARTVVARVSPATAAAAGVSDGEKVTVTTTAGALTIPVEVTPMADDVVWLPTASAGSAVRTDLGAGHGSRVTLRRSE
jgi:NADH-quinone oxidoreductase subunit G